MMNQIDRGSFDLRLYGTVTKYKLRGSTHQNSTLVFDVAVSKFP